MESEVTKGILGKANPKDGSVSDHITAPVCESEPPSPFVTAEVCPTEVSTDYNDAECRCKPEKVVVSEGVQVSEPVEQVVTQPMARTPEEAVPVVFLPVAGEDVRFQFPSPYLSPVQSPVQSPPLVQFQFQCTPPALSFPHVSLPPPPSPIIAREPAPAPPVLAHEPVVEAEPIREQPIT